MNHLDTVGKSWFDSLLPWDELDLLLVELAEAERAEAVSTIMATFDYAVTETVLSQLHQDHHFEFLELCHQQYHEPTVLFWLETKSQGITEQIRVTVMSVHQEVARVVVGGELPQ